MLPMNSRAECCGVSEDAMYAPKYRDVSYKFEIFKEIRDERRPLERFCRDLFQFKRACETQKYVRGRDDVE